jgi:WD40 repeat protein
LLRRRAKEVFLAALAVPPSARAAVVAVQCGEDAGLRQMVEGLLQAHTQAEALFGPPPEVSAPVRAGDRVGPYRLVRRLGEGGFGVVFLAVQDEPIARQVALKLLKAAHESAQVAERFRLERETLARMDHPGIARVLDAGATAHGQSWVAIEFVDGAPITEHCDAHCLPLRARLQLFEAVCLAVQHAHHKGVVHRDLKPGNVLVTRIDGQSVPKVIDFGIAKAVGGEGFATLTHADQIIGTPEYMAPEQAGAAAADIDTRADVYSLGVLLYRLLTGTSPYDSERIARGGLLAWSRAICEDDTPRPSTRVRAVAAAPAIAAARATTPDRLARDLSGELDWIVLKAMQKERSRRYATAAAFAADVRRVLEQRPVEAGPPSAVYRLRKFCARHRLAALALGLAVVAVVAGSVLTTIWAVAATRAQASAEQHSYAASLFAADAALRRCETRQARRQLAAAPAHLRGFEWQLLAARADRSRVVHDIANGRAEAMRCRAGVAAFATSAGELLAFDASSGALRARCAGLAPPVRQVTIDGAGAAAFAGGGDGGVVRWHIADGTRQEARHDGAVESVDLSHDDRLLVTGGLDATARLWDARTLAPQAVLSHDAPVALVRSSPDGAHVAAATWDEALSLWDVRSRQRIARVRLTSAPTPAEPARYALGNVTALAFAPDGQRLAAGLRDGRLAVLEVRGAVLWTRDEHARLVRDVCWSPDGTRLLCAARDERATLWSAQGELIANLPHAADVRAATFSPHGQVAVTAAFDSTVRAFDGRTGVPRGELLGHGDAVFGVSFTDDGAHLWSFGLDRQVRQWPAHAALLDARPLAAWCLAVQFTAGGKLVAGDVFGVVHAFAQAEGVSSDPAATLHDTIHAMAASPVDELVACALDSGAITLVRPGATDTPRRVTAHTAPAKAVAFTARGDALVSASADGTVRVADLEGGELAVLARTAAVRELAACGDRGMLALEVAGDLAVFDLAQRTQTRRWPAVVRAPESLAVRPGHALAALGSDQGDIVLFDLARGTAVRTLRGHDEAVTALAWLPDGSRLVSASRDGTVRIWDPARDDALLALRAGVAPLHAVAVSADGKWVAACGEYGVLRTWGCAVRN